MAPHSSTLAWKIPRMEEPGGLQSTQGPSEALQEQVVLGWVLGSLRSSYLLFLSQILPGQDASRAATAGPRGRKRKISLSGRAKGEGMRMV